MKADSQIKLGIIFVLFGMFLIAKKQFPEIEHWVEANTEYPLNIVLFATVGLILSLVLDLTGFAPIATLVAGIGGILYYQKITGSNELILWILVPGFLGIGMIQAALFNGNMREAKSGTKFIGFSIVLFLIFAFIFNRLQLLGFYGFVILLIITGLWFIIRALKPQKDKPDIDITERHI